MRSPPVTPPKNIKVNINDIKNIKISQAVEGLQPDWTPFRTECSCAAPVHPGQRGSMTPEERSPGCSGGQRATGDGVEKAGGQACRPGREALQSPGGRDSKDLPA